MRAEKGVPRYEGERVDLITAGYRALLQTLGFADTIRFLVRIRQGRGDYLALRERIFGETSVDDLYEQAETHCKQQK